MEDVEILDDHLGEERTYEDASHGSRLANYLLDLIGVYVTMIILVFVTAFAGILDPHMFDESNNPGTSNLLGYLIGGVSLVGYYTLLEYTSKGKSLGKLITRTRAISEDGQKLTLTQALLRSLCRLVPFEQFSFLGGTTRGWHDRWTNTRVIKDKDWKP
ncbi:MAG: RDD family protein [Flavobacteriales bacterium]|nr:RDD family protein [Flavobacteriales bacterium]